MKLIFGFLLTTLVSFSAVAQQHGGGSVSVEAEDKAPAKEPQGVLVDEKLYKDISLMDMAAAMHPQFFNAMPMVPMNGPPVLPKFTAMALLDLEQELTGPREIKIPFNGEIVACTLKPLNAQKVKKKVMDWASGEMVEREFSNMPSSCPKGSYSCSVNMGGTMLWFFGKNDQIIVLDCPLQKVDPKTGAVVSLYSAQVTLADLNAALKGEKLGVVKFYNRITIPKPIQNSKR